MLKLIVKLLFDFTRYKTSIIEQETHKKIWFARNFQGHIRISTVQMITFIIAIFARLIGIKMYA